MFSDLLPRLRLTRSVNRAARRPSRRLGLERLETREVPAVVYGLTDANALVRFDSATPGTTTTIPITGLQGTDHVLGIDFRPRTGQLYATTAPAGVVANALLDTYVINPLTGAATLVGSIPGGTVPGAADTIAAYDFNPTVDRIRLVLSNGANIRINPNNGSLAGSDVNLSFTAPAAGPVLEEAYDRNFDRTSASPIKTTLYGIDLGSNMLVIQGGIDGAPSPNGGVISAVNPLGLTLDAGSEAGFDIADSTANGGKGTALAALKVGGVTGLYSIDLTTGAATSIGAIGNGTTAIRGLAVVPTSTLIVGSGAGATADVRSLNPSNGAVLAAISTPFPGFQGGVRVASGDVNGDGIPDFIVSAVAPQGHVKVFDGVTGVQLPGFIGSFFAFAGFNGTVNVGSGDVNGDGFDDVIVVANGANGHVKAFSGKDGTELASFLAYDGFLGNVTVSAADFNNDGLAEIVTAAAINGHVKVFNADGTPFTSGPNFVNSFFGFSPYLGDVAVAAGDVNGDGIPDLTLSSGPGVPLNVRVFNGQNEQALSSFLVLGFGSSYTGGGDVGLSDVNNDGRYEVVVTPNAGTQANVLAFDAFGAALGSPFAAFANFQGGATVAGQRF
jgi:hypothetical protein